MSVIHTFSASYSSINSCRSFSGASFHICAIILDTSQSFNSGLAVFTWSHTFRLYRMKGINGFSGGLGGLGIRGSTWKEIQLMLLNGIYHHRKSKLTTTPPLPIFWGVNAGFPCVECMNGLELSLPRSPDPPDGLSRSDATKRENEFS